MRRTEERAIGTNRRRTQLFLSMDAAEADVVAFSAPSFYHDVLFYVVRSIC